MYTDVKGMHNGLFLTRQHIIATVNPKLENISLQFTIETYLLFSILIVKRITLQVQIGIR